MLLVKIKNKSERTVIVPFSSLVSNPTQVTDTAEPGGDASCVFMPPQTSQVIQEAILSWSNDVGVDVDVVFSVPDWGR